MLICILTILSTASLKTYLETEMKLMKPEMFQLLGWLGFLLYINLVGNILLLQKTNEKLSY